VEIEEAIMLRYRSAVKRLPAILEMESSGSLQLADDDIML
jgi:hypothetical protein